MSIFAVPIYSPGAVIDDRQINVLLPMLNPDDPRPYSVGLPIISNLVTGIPPDENVLGGINQAMVVNGLEVILDPWTEMGQGDNWIIQATCTGMPPYSVLADSVKGTEVGERIFRTLPADQLRDGVCELRLGVRRISNTGGDFELSAPLVVLIKTTLPGGPDPDPSEPFHQSLPQLQVSNDVLINGVTKDYLDEYNGLPVTIAPYEFMRKNSSILIFYGEQIVQLPRVTAAQVGLPIRFTIPRQVIEREGTAIPVKLNHIIVDVVENRAAAPSIPLYFNSQPTLDLLEAPIVDRADENDRLDIAALDGEGVLTIISSRKISFAPGDKVDLSWLGVSSGGHEVPDNQTWLPTQSTRSHDFLIPYYKAHLISRGSATVDYTHTRGTTITDSRKAYVTITGLPALLLPPEVPEAIGGSVPAQTPLAHVFVKSQPGAIILGDVVRMNWHVLRADGSEYTYEAQRSVSEALVNTDIPFDIQASEIQRGDGGKLTVSYVIYRPLVEPQLSEKLLLFIGDTLSELPPPEVPAVKDGILVPESVPLGAEAIIRAYDGMRDLDLVKLDFIGATPQDSWSRTWDSLKPEEVGVDLADRVPFNILVANRNQDVWLVYATTNRFTGRVRTSQKMPLRIGMPVPAPDITMVRDSTGVEIPRGSQTFSGTATLSGTAGVSELVEIRNHGILVTTATSTPQRTWSYQFNPLAPGAYAFTVQTPGSNRPSVSWEFTALESQIPTISSVQAGGTHVPHNGGTYYQTRTSIRGTATSGHRIEIREGETILGYVTASGGLWTLPERGFSVGPHTLTAVTLDGSSNASQPYTFTVQQGLYDEVTHFAHTSFNGWAIGNAVGSNDLSWYFDPTGVYVLLNYTNHNAAAGTVFYKTLNNLTPDATYSITIAARRHDGRAISPVLLLRTNTTSSSGIYLTHFDFRPYTLFFTPTTPQLTLFIDSWLSGGVGNDWAMAWIQTTKR